ncbi:MAG: luciferase family protein [Actinomycetia bacterium]|nr:luciferase family protein [Actinomycetes bacterium]
MAGRGAFAYRQSVRLGVTVFLTDLTIDPVQLARASEERGFASLYVPEHTHFPLHIGHDLPNGQTELDNGYQRTLDPYIALAAAAAVTEHLALGTGISLIVEHDPITLAKQIATLDHLSNGRFVLGLGYGWNRAELTHHRVAYGERRDVTREYVLAMQALWGDEVASFDGKYVSFTPSLAWPKPVQRPRVRTLIGGSAGPKLFAHIAEYADGWMPIGGAGVSGAIAELRGAFEAAGRDPATAQVVPFGTVPDAGKLDYYESLGIEEVVLRLPAAGYDEVLATLDTFTSFLDG